jgi:hypothetical protein
MVEERPGRNLFDFFDPSTFSTLAKALSGKLDTHAGDRYTGRTTKPIPD